MSLSAKNVGTVWKSYKNGRKLRTILSALNARVLQSRYGRRAPFTSKAAAGCQSTNNMEIHANMQGWYAVIIDSDIVAAFLDYEDALKYKKTREGEGRPIIIEKIIHRRG